MKAGHALDVKIAMEVMGLEFREWKPFAAPEGWFPKDHPPCCPKAEHGCIPYGHDHPSELPYSTDIERAWEVVDKLTMTTKQWFSLEQYSTGATAKFSIIGAGDLDCEVEADEITVPHAICLAALKAVGKVAK